jgi:putative transposase
MSRQVSPSTDRVYGLQRVTRLWGVSRATVYRHRRPDQGERRRPGPVGAMSDEALVEAIRKLLRDSPFHGEGGLSGIRCTGGRLNLISRPGRS